MIKAGQDLFGKGRFAVPRSLPTGRLPGSRCADWPEPLQAPAATGALASGWWIVAALPVGLAGWAALGWLLFAT